MSDWLKKIHDNQDKIWYSIEDLYGLANAFYQIGNNRIANKLNKISSNIGESLKQISDAVSQNINENFKQSQEHSATILKAVFVGRELERSNSNESKT